MTLNTNDIPANTWIAFDLPIPGSLGRIPCLDRYGSRLNPSPMSMALLDTLAADSFQLRGDGEYLRWAPHREMILLKHCTTDRKQKQHSPRDMAFASSNPFNPPPYESNTNQPLPHEHNIKQPHSDTYLSPEIQYDEKMRSQSPLPPSTPRRGSHESSPTQSVYSDSQTLVDAPTKSAIRTLDVFHTRSHLNLRIHDPSKNNTCIYYVEHSAFTPKKPDVLLFAGSDKQGSPMAGVATWSSMYSKDIHIGLGDAGVKLENSPSIPWEKMTSTSGLKQNEHHWKLSNDLNHEYVWKRTHHVGVEDEHNSWSGCNFKLLDKHTDEVLATFASNRFKAWRKFGKFTFRTDLGKEWELMALLTCLALIEKSRRRSRARRSNQHGGP